MCALYAWMVCVAAAVERRFLISLQKCALNGKKEAKCALRSFHLFLFFLVLSLTLSLVLFPRAKKKKRNSDNDNNNEAKREKERDKKIRRKHSTVLSTKFYLSYLSFIVWYIYLYVLNEDKKKRCLCCLRVSFNSVISFVWNSFQLETTTNENKKSSKTRKKNINFCSFFRVKDIFLKRIQQNETFVRLFYFFARNECWWLNKRKIILQWNGKSSIN